MPFARSFYADQKPVEKPQSSTSVAVAAVPAVTPIAEDPLSPTQIQEAIRLYRSVLSNSTPSSPVAATPVEQPAEPEKPCIYSNYYGGGPTDIPQSYLNFTNSPSKRAPTPPPPVEQVAAPQIAPEQLADRLQNLSVQKAEEIAQPAPVQKPQVVRREEVNAQRMYDDEESGYCFNKVKREENVQEFVEEEVENGSQSTPIPEAVEQPKYIAAPVVERKYQPTGPSEYIGMANDNKFIYDKQNALPPSYSSNNYTMVNFSKPPQVAQQQFAEPENGTTTTEDITQMPASPAPNQSRFRGLIKNVSSTPTNSHGPIVVERVAEQSAHYNAYGAAFAPVNFASMESEYQLPVLNDLASCIENY